MILPFFIVLPTGHKIISMLLLLQQQESEGKRQYTELLLLLGQSSPTLPFLVQA